MGLVVIIMIVLIEMEIVKQGTLVMGVVVVAPPSSKLATKHIQLMVVMVVPVVMVVQFVMFLGHRIIHLVMVTKVLLVIAVIVRLKLTGIMQFFFLPILVGLVLDHITRHETARIMVSLVRLVKYKLFGYTAQSHRLISYLLHMKAMN